ncbi:MAG: TonB-dependent receptor plug domain-containing protein [Bacteroidota bacterium]
MRPLKLLISRWLITVVLAVVSSVANELCAQANLKESIWVDTTQCSVQHLLEQLRTVQNLRLAYSESYLNVQQTVSLASTTPTLAELLNAISRATGTVYEVRGNQIIFRRKNAKFTISGYIRDAHSGEDLIGASIWRCASTTPDSSIAQAMVGASSNNYGFYSLTLPAADSVHLRCSFVGHASQATSIVLHQDTVINWSLDDAMLAEVMVTSSSTQSVEQLSPDLPIAPTFLFSTPVLLGEVDVLKGLQRLPGVQAGVDGSADLYVRGSSPDQNLMLLDGVPVYNATHLFGFFSVFNADAINNINFYKGGFPARYGGRLASVIDVQLKEGNREKFQGTGSIGLLSSRLTLEGPLVSEKTSFLVSGRYGHLGLMTRLLTNALDGNERFIYGFHDLIAKVNHSFSHRNQLYFSAYSGRDLLKNGTQYQDSAATTELGKVIGLQTKSQWGNLTTALRWNHVFNRQLFSNVTLTRSRYRYRDSESQMVEIVQNEATQSEYEYRDTQVTGISDWAAKLDFDLLPNPRHHFRFGGSVIQHEFQPNSLGFIFHSDGITRVDTTYGVGKQYGTEVDIYAEDEIQWSSALTANVGFRMTGFWVGGAPFLQGQPRLSLHYQPSLLVTGWASYTRMAQFMHLLVGPYLNAPTDQWLPTSRELPPETAQQWTAGYRRKLGDFYTVQAEGYYKDMRQVVGFRSDGFDLTEEATLGQSIISGRGRAYGIELLTQRSGERLTGWLGYTWSRSERQFDEIDQGEWFPFQYDRRHEIDFGGVFHWKENIDLSWGWGLATGFALTLPTVTFIEKLPPKDETGFEKQVRTVSGARNSFRSRATHRLDISISFRKKSQWGERTWEIGLYNAYNRRNPFILNSRGRDGNTLRFWQISLLPILPMASYRFKF